MTFRDVRVDGGVWTGAADANLVIDPAATANIRFVVSR